MNLLRAIRAKIFLKIDEQLNALCYFNAVNNYFRKIGLAIAFSPTAEAMLAEASRLANLFSAELVLIHVGDHGAEEEQKLAKLAQGVGLKNAYKLEWRKGDPVREILKACNEGQIDLLVAGALKKEKMVKHYVGSVARAIMRKADCSVYMVNNPSVNPQPIQQIVVNAEDSPYVERAIAIGCRMAELEKSSWVHIVRELKLLGLALTASEQSTEQEYSDYKHGLMQDEINSVEKILASIPHENLKINIKMLSGKSGFELCKFVEKKQGGLLVVGAPQRRLSFFDRIFPHDLEYVFGELPCNLLVVNQPKQNG
jgi:nucleotide-binding universal stress UspA family protein